MPYTPKTMPRKKLPKGAQSISDAARMRGKGGQELKGYRNLKTRRNMETGEHIPLSNKGEHKLKRQSQAYQAREGGTVKKQLTIRQIDMRQRQKIAERYDVRNQKRLPKGVKTISDAASRRGRGTSLVPPHRTIAGETFEPAQTRRGERVHHRRKQAIESQYRKFRKAGDSREGAVRSSVQERSMLTENAGRVQDKTKREYGRGRNPESKTIRSTQPKPKLPKGVGSTLGEVAKGRGKGGQITKRVRISHRETEAATPRAERATKAVDASVRDNPGKTADAVRREASVAQKRDSLVRRGKRRSRLGGSSRPRGGSIRNILSPGTALQAYEHGQQRKYYKSLYGGKPGHKEQM